VYPNPYRDYVSINYNLYKAGKVCVIIFDIHGRKIETIVDMNQAEGNYLYTFHVKSKGLLPGNYFIQLQVNHSVYLKKIIQIE
ncbi:MAG: T9SS type A sorting domain-containing protein, partial [Bacteroidia bacterium]|nr:T9SS type A sorting domain-containing protein [Bacteroidia bacterium]MBI5219167.1 T9SS type A sorting domain-containing protein [Bacteroidia bacterium]